MLHLKWYIYFSIQIRLLNIICFSSLTNSMLHYVTTQMCLFNGQDLFQILISWRKTALNKLVQQLLLNSSWIVPHTPQHCMARHEGVTAFSSRSWALLSSAFSAICISKSILKEKIPSNSFPISCLGHGYAFPTPRQNSDTFFRRILLLPRYHFWPWPQTHCGSSPPDMFLLEMCTHTSMCPCKLVMLDKN